MNAYSHHTPRTMAKTGPAFFESNRGYCRSMMAQSYLAFICLAYLPSCAASDEAPKGARPGHPGEPTAQPRPASTVSALDQAILEDYPPRPWSKNVPSQTCSRDEECGDGFCDRGRCAAVWTAAGLLGQRCASHERCVSYLCIDGRCRSCVSDAECIDEPDNQDPVCISKPFVPGSRGCVGVTPSGEGSVVPSPPAK